MTIIMGILGFDNDYFRYVDLVTENLTDCKLECMTRSCRVNSSYWLGSCNHYIIVYMI